MTFFYFESNEILFFVERDETWNTLINSKKLSILFLPFPSAQCDSYLSFSKISIFWMKGATDLNKFVLWGRRETIEEIEKTAGLAIFKYQLLGINIVCLFFAIFAHIIYICCFFSFYYHYLVSSFLYFLFLFLLYFYFTFILFLQRNNL